RAPRAAVSALADGTGRTTTSEGAIAGGRPSAADGASAAAREGACAPRMKFHPQRWAKVYDHWLANIQDWCISRQLWWGHQAPVWHQPEDWGTMEQITGALNYLQELKAANRKDVVVRFPETGKTATDDKGEPLTGIAIEVCLAPSATDVASKLEAFG